MKLLFLSFLMMVSVTSHADSMLDYMDGTKHLIEVGKYEEALKRTVWFHDHAMEYDNSIASVRLSFALSDWSDFGEIYSPALTALINIRDEKTKKILNRKGSVDLFNDVSAINKILSEETKTLSMFKKLELNQPSLANQCWPFVREIAMKRKDLALIKKYSVDVLSEYQTAEELLKFNLNQFGDDENLILMSKNTFVEIVLELISLASTLDDDKAASLIRERAVKFVELKNEPKEPIPCKTKVKESM